MTLNRFQLRTIHPAEIPFYSQTCYSMGTSGFGLTSAVSRYGGEQVEKMSE